MSTNPKEAASNVVQLRTSLGETQLYNARESIDIAKQTKQDFCEEVVEFSMEQWFTVAKSFGFFNNEHRIHTKDVVMLEKAMESILFRYQGLDHPLHEVVEDMIKIKGEEDEDEDDSDEIAEEVLEDFIDDGNTN